MFLGFDFSTQQLKSIVIDEKREVKYEAHVSFDHDLPEFRTHKGVVRSEKKVVTAPVLMWVKAVDMILEKLRVCGADFSKVIAISGTAQQHGTVYWAAGAEEQLKGLDDAQFLHSQLASCFTITSSPIWQDSSTTAQCRSLEEAVGGPEELAKITGSKAFERYSAAQIMKIFETKPTAYRNTERISLVSSFGCSLFLGKYAPIDYSDGSGMNLLDITNKKWSEKCLNACAPDLAEKLGEAVPSNTVLGKISNYYVERFGFSEDCSVVAFTGDNQSTIVGLGLKENDIAVSLGTSDTLIMWTSSPSPIDGGHILLSPVPSHEYIALICFKNGSVTRERIRDSYASGSWETFDKLLNSSPRGNLGYFGLYYDHDEITVPLVGEFRFDSYNNIMEKFPASEIEVRSLLEGQFIAKRSMLEEYGLDLGKSTRIIATGGASINIGILQVLSDVFNAPVYTIEECNSGVLGAAFRAQEALGGSGDQLVTDSSMTLVATPYDNAGEVYDTMVPRYREIINKILNK